VEYIARVHGKRTWNPGIRSTSNTRRNYTSDLKISFRFFEQLSKYDGAEYRRIVAIPGYVALLMHFESLPLVDHANAILEPISPQTSHETPASAEGNTSRSTPSSTSANPAHPSITGLIKHAVHAGSHHERVNEEPGMTDAINAVGDDGGEKSV
jgi:hypothetical protein